jgi:RNA polymerase sigma factor (sigma-70 family)
MFSTPGSAGRLEGEADDAAASAMTGPGRGVAPRPGGGSSDGERLVGERSGGNADDTALAALYRAESSRLVRMMARRVSSRDEAEDLVQDAFCRLARVDGQRTALERPSAYLRRIAANLLKDRARTAGRRSEALHVVADEETLAGHDQQRHLEARDMLVRVEAAIMRLRPKTREIFMAHRVHGLSYEEIAERTGLSIKGVEKQMGKALVQLHRLLRRT